MQHESAPGADAERAEGVCARRSNALKRVLNAGLASCLLWEQQAAPSELRFTLQRVFLGRFAAVEGVFVELFVVWCTVSMWPLKKIHLRRGTRRYNEGRFPRASDVGCPTAILSFHLGCEITLQHPADSVDAAHESGETPGWYTCSPRRSA